MIRHIVILTFKPQTSPSAIRALTEGLMTLPAKIPEIAHYQVGTDLQWVDGNGDFGLTADFESQSAFQTYADHPEHQAVLDDLIRPHVAHRVAVQIRL